METHKHNVKFKVSLSNGETHYEGKGQFQEIPNELSPWNKLINYTIQKKCLITSLSLYTDDGRTFNLPSLGKSPKFREFSNIDKPIDFNLFRKIASDMDAIRIKERIEVGNKEVTDWYTVAEAIYKDYRLQIWVDEFNTKNSWVLVKK